MDMQHELDNVPPPLDWFNNDFIHPDNQALLDQEQKRWRLLRWWERLKLQHYVASLRRDLRRADYNGKLIELDRLRRTFRRERDTLKGMTDEADRQAAKTRLLALRKRAAALTAALNDLQSTYENFQHYAGWLDYEREHRDELKQEDKRARKIKKEMDREAANIENLLKDVFRKTNGCHHTSTNGKGKITTKVPKFERSKISANAHYFYLAASKWFPFVGYRWLLPDGVTIDRLKEDEVIHNLSAATKRQVSWLYSDMGQLMFRVARLDSPDALPTEVKWREAMRFFPNKERSKYPYCIGVSEGKRFQFFDLASYAHILVAGMSQSGKSTLVNGIIAMLASIYSPDELRIVLIDQKGGIEFTHWKELPHLLGDMVKTVDEVQPVFNRVVAIMRKRMDLLEKTKAKDMDSYNAKVDQPYRLARVLVVLDEMNTFVGLGKRTEEIQNLLMLLVSQGRAVGINVIAATQHPEVKVIPGRVKTNMSVRLSGFMPTVSASMLVLDNPEASRLPAISGRFAAVVGLKKLVVQVPRIYDDDIAGVVSSCRQQYPDVAEELSDARDMPRLVIWDEQRVLAASLDWLKGQISGDELHKMLGPDESPGIRDLRRICRRLRDSIAASGSITREDDGTEWKIKKIRSTYYLVPANDTTNTTSTTNTATMEDLNRPTVAETFAVNENTPEAIGEAAAD